MTKHKIPPYRCGPALKYAWYKVAPGKPLKIPGKTMSQIASTAYAAARRLGVRFALRSGKNCVTVYLASK